MCESIKAAGMTLLMCESARAQWRFAVRLIILSSSLVELNDAMIDYMLRKCLMTLERFLMELFLVVNMTDMCTIELG